MMAWLTDPHAWASLITLTVMEVVLGIDNIVFISVIVARLPDKIRERARRIGLALAFIFRAIMLLGITWLIGLTMPVFTLFGEDFSWRDIVLIGGGLFLIAKATHEIHKEFEDQSKEPGYTSVAASGFTSAIAQIAVIDMVFSVDSIITAVGMADHVEIMVAAVLIAILIMYAASGPVAEFIDRYPTVKMLALSFLFLIGAALIADGISFHIPRGYIYFAMAFAAGVEIINTLLRRRRARRQKKA